VAGFLASALVLPAVARAGEASQVMHSWRQNLRMVSEMLNGGAPYDQAWLRQAMAAYAVDASSLAGRMNTGTLDGRDLQRRFLDFAALGQQSTADVSRPDALRADVSRMKAQCDACHAIYN